MCFQSKIYAKVSKNFHSHSKGKITQKENSNSYRINIFSVYIISMELKKNIEDAQDFLVKQHKCGKNQIDNLTVKI